MIEDNTETDRQVAANQIEEALKATLSNIDEKEKPAEKEAEVEKEKEKVITVEETPVNTFEKMPFK